MTEPVRRRGSIFRGLGAVVVAMLVVMGLGGTAPVAARPSGGEWPLPRADVVNSGHQPVPGRIERPGVAARHYLGGSTGFVLPVDLDGDGSDELLYLTAGRVVAANPDLSPRWATPGLNPADIIGVYDLDGDGANEVVVISTTSVIVLAGADGAVAWQWDFGNVLDDGWLKVADVDVATPGLELVVWPYFSAHGLAFAFDQGVAAGRQLWQSSPAYENPAYVPEVIVADFDGDGANEVAMAGVGTIRAFDGATGVLRSGTWNGRVDWISGPGIDGRNYGQFEAVNLDADPQVEIVMVADGVTLHVAVIQNDAAGFSLLWDRFIDYPENLKSLRTTINAVDDLDGDGRVEVAVSVFNDTGDNRWHLLVVDALTGFDSPELDLADGYLQGVRDLDGDGDRELLISREPARTPAARSSLEVWSVGAGGVFEPVWQTTNAAYVMDPEVPPPATVSPNSRNTAREAMDGAPLAGWLIVQDGALIGFTLDGAAVTETYRRAFDAGVVHRVADLDGDGEAELVLQEEPGSPLIAERADGTVLGETQLGSLGSAPTVADLDNDGTNEVMAPAFGSARVFSWEPGGALTESWRTTGQGQMVYLGGRQATSAYDLDGDGDREVVVADAFGDHSRLRVLDAQGGEVWSHVFDDLPAPTPGNGVYTWAFGNFTGDEVTDLYVAAFAGGYNTEVSRMLDGRDGALLAARNDNPERPGIGFGPWVGHVAVADLNGNGLDEAVFLAKDVTYAIDGTDMAEPRVLTGHAGLYHNPTLVDVTGDGRLEMVMAAGFNFLDVVSFAADPDGSTLWQVEVVPGELLGRQSGLADVDGDGRLELGTYSSAGVVVSRDAATGAEEWRYELPATGSNLTTVDVNRDGRADYVLGTDDGQLVALDGRPDAPSRVLWTLDVGYAVGDVAAANVDRDRWSELVFAAADGYLYVVDQTRGR